MAINFGVASEYNVFILGNMTMSSTDAEGRVAVAGKATLTGYGVGASILPLPPFGTDNSLVIGGDVDINAETNSCGNTVRNPASTVINYSMGNPNGIFTTGTPIDFAAATTYLQSASLYWGGLTPNGTGAVTFGKLTLTGTDPSLNIFTVDSSNVAGSGLSLSGLNGIDIEAPAGSTILINVTGTNIAFGSYQIFRNNVAATRTDAHDIVWNFPQATAWTNSTTAIYGSVLAPLASATTTFSQINGNIMLANISGTSESHNELFTGNLPDLPGTPEADVYVTKEAIPHPVAPGAVLTYTIIVGNNGPDTAVDVTLTDAIDSKLVSPEYSLTGAAPWSSWGGSLPLGDIASGTTVTVTIRGTVDATATGSIPNTADAYSSTTHDPNLSNNTMSISTTIESQTTSADVYLTKTSAPDPVDQGAVLTYTIIVGNNGPDTAVDVNLTDTISTKLISPEYSLTGAAPWSAWGGSLPLGDIASGATITVTIRSTVDATATGTIPNTAAAYSSTTYDPDTSNNTHSINTTITSQAPSADIYVTKTSEPNPVDPGAVLTYQITVGNNGPDTSENVVLTDIITTDLINPEYLVGGILPWADWTGSLPLGNLGMGDTIDIQIRGTVSQVAGCVISNTANVDSDTTDPDLSNNTASVDTINSNCMGSYVEMIKTANTNCAMIGDIIVYTINIINSGPTVAEQFTITDTLPDGVTYNNHLMLDGTEIPGDITLGVNIGDVLVGTSTVSFEVIVEAVPSNPTHEAINQALAHYEYHDPLGTEPIPVDIVSSISSVSVYNPSLQLLKLVNDDEVIIGETVTYEVDVINDGDVTLNHVILSDVLSAEVEYIIGSVTINGVSAPQENILAGIQLGTLLAAQTRVVTFKAKVLTTNKQNKITNTAQAEYMCQICDKPVRVQTSVSNPITIEVYEAKLKVLKKADREEASLGDTITYTVEITNEGTLTAYNVNVTDTLPPEVSLVPGSFKVDGKVVNGVQLNKGITIPSIIPGQTVIISYQVKVVGSRCTGEIINQVEVIFDYRLPNGTSGTVKADDSQSSTTVNLTLSTFKQMSVENYLTIPEVKPDIEAIQTVTGTVTQINYHVIETMMASSAEGQKLTGYKLIVRGNLEIVVEYTALNEQQSVHSAHYSVPFSTFIVLPSNYQVGSKLEVTGLVEDVFYQAMDIRNFFVNTTVLINVKIIC